jgi:prophage regulatory protein
MVSQGTSAGEKQVIKEFDRLPDGSFIRLKDLRELHILPFSTSTLWRKVKVGSFPAPTRISDQIVAWRLGDIREWLKDPVSWVQS